jgi:hypothetical protein
VCEHVELGRICPEMHFHRRIAANVAALERVAGRDQRYARTLDEAAAHEAERS